MIDADIGLRNLDVIMGLENRIVYDLVDIVEGRAKAAAGNDQTQESLRTYFLDSGSSNP